MLQFWGSAEECIKKDINSPDKYFWFDSKEQRLEFRNKIESIAEKHKETVVFDEEEGTQTRYRTIAKMTMVFPNGKKYDFEYDFGYGYPEHSAEYMFFDGNYGCDCNRSLFLSRIHNEIKETGCGDDIKLEDFNIIFKK